MKTVLAASVLQELSNVLRVKESPFVTEEARLKAATQAGRHIGLALIDATPGQIRALMEPRTFPVVQEDRPAGDGPIGEPGPGSRAGDPQSASPGRGAGPALRVIQAYSPARCPAECDR